MAATEDQANHMVNNASKMLDGFADRLTSYAPDFKGSLKVRAHTTTPFFPSTLARRPHPATHYSHYFSSHLSFTLKTVPWVWSGQQPLMVSLGHNHPDAIGLGVDCGASSCCRCAEPFRTTQRLSLY
jgi:hypothetical protein